MAKQSVSSPRARGRNPVPVSHQDSREIISLSGEEADLRTLIYQAVQKWGVMAPREQLKIENEFLRLARLQMRAAAAPAAGDSGSISAALSDALDEQRMALHEAQAVIECADAYIDHGMRGADDEWRPQLALGAAKKMLDDVWESLDAGNLEARALAIARANGSKDGAVS